VIRTATASTEIVPGLYRLGDIGGVNAYLWMPRPNHSDSGETILFDCGWPWSGRDLAASLARLGCRPADVRTLAITHADFDHVGQLAAFADEGHTEILAHEQEAPRLVSGQWRILPGAGRSLDPMILLAGPAYRRWPACPVKVSRPLCDGDAIGGGWIAIHTPGHTPGHLAFYRPESRVLLAGDALGSVRNRRIRLPKRIYAEDWAAALRSVRKLGDLEPDVICFGHGRELHQASDLLQALAGSLSAEEISQRAGRL
jgi:glyoxylase-like metal-dependent hydrolase (beta-lactamase superfamily II)